MLYYYLTLCFKKNNCMLLLSFLLLDLFIPISEIALIITYYSGIGTLHKVTQQCVIRPYLFFVLRDFKD